MSHNSIDKNFVSANRTFVPGKKSSTSGKAEKGGATESTPELTKDEVNFGSSGTVLADGSDQKVEGQPVAEQPKVTADKGPETPSVPAGLVIPATTTSGMNSKGIITLIDDQETSVETNRFEAAEAELHAEGPDWGDRAKKFGMAAAMTTVAFAGFAGTAQAQVATVNTQQLTRSTAPVRVSSPSEAVSEFSAENQLYVIGNPTLRGENVNLDRMANALKDHPNIYVVLDGAPRAGVDDVSFATPDAIARGSEFESVTHHLNGEENGAVFYVSVGNKYDDGSTDLVVSMRSAGLLDANGVGEDAWTSESGAARELKRLFDSELVDQSKDLPGSLDTVFGRINSTVNGKLESAYSDAQSDVSAARSTLTGAESRATGFQRKHGSGGSLGSPNVRGWRSEVSRAEKALQDGDFTGASRIANAVKGEMSQYVNSVSSYEGAPGIASDIQSRLSQLKGQLDGLPDNSHAQNARDAYSQATSSLNSFNTSYEAKNSDFSTHLTQADQATNDVASSIRSSHSADQTMKNVKVGGTVAATVGILALGFVTNMKARKAGKKAQAELKEAKAELAEKSDQLLALLEKAEFNTLAGFEGETKKLADEVMDKTMNALVLVGGAEKFMAEAENDLKGGNLFDKIKRTFSAAKANRVQRLLSRKEGGEELSFGSRDASRVVMQKGSKAESWKDRALSPEESREFKTTLRNLDLMMAENYDSANAGHEEIVHKNDQVSVFLNEITEDASATRQQSLSLQKAGEKDNLFTAPSVNNHLLANVLAGEDQGGLLATGRTISQTDPVKAWDEFGAKAKRMTEDAGEALEIGQEARQTLLPTMEQADAQLLQHGVETEWAHTRKKELSGELDELAVTGTRTDISEDLRGLRKKNHSLNSQVQTVMEQDTTRREVSPKEIASAKQDVQETREFVFAELQKAGAFRSGSVEGIMREPELDPSERTEDADENLAAIPGELSQGDIAEAGTHIKNIKSLTAEAHSLADQTREALASYPGTLEERQTRHTNITGSINKTYAPSMKRIEANYAPKVMRQVAGEVGAGETLADNIKSAKGYLQTGSEQTISAVKNFDKAFLLTARDDLNDTDKTLKQAQGQLDAVTNAETLLGKKQQNVESGLATLVDNLGKTRRNSNQHFVRSRASKLYSDAHRELKDAKSLVNGAVKSPYDADAQIKKAENLRGQAEQAIAADKAAFNLAESRISEADSSINTADTKIGEARRWSKTTNVSGHSPVSTSTGSLQTEINELGTARSLLKRAQRALDSKEYEEAAELAGKADSAADSAYAGAKGEISSASTSHNSKVSAAKRKVRLAKEAAEKKKRDAARAKRQAAQRKAAARTRISTRSTGTRSGRTRV